MTRFATTLLFIVCCSAASVAQVRDTTNADSTDFQRSVREEVTRVLRSLGLNTAADSIQAQDDTTAHKHPRHEKGHKHAVVEITSGKSEPQPFNEWMDFSDFRYNRVDGLFLGLGSNAVHSLPSEKLSDSTAASHWPAENSLRARTGLGYAFGSHFWTVEGGLSFLHRFNPEAHNPSGIELGAEGHVRTDTRDAWIVPIEENNAAALFAHEDFPFYYFKRKGWSATGTLYAGNEQLSVSYRSDKIFSMAKHEYWSFFGGSKRYPENWPVTTGTMPAVVVTSYFNNVSTSRMYHGWSVLAQVEFGSGDFVRNRYVLDIRRYQPLARWSEINLRLRAAAVQGMAANIPVGKPVAVVDPITGNTTYVQNYVPGFLTPKQDYFHLGGISTLPAFHEGEYDGNRMLLLNAEWGITGRALDAMLWFPFHDMMLMIVADAGMSYFVDDTIKANQGWKPLAIASMKSDIGFAVGSENGSFRMGLVWRTDYNDGAKFFIRLARPF